MGGPPASSSSSSAEEEAKKRPKRPKATPPPSPPGPSSLSSSREARRLPSFSLAPRRERRPPQSPSSCRCRPHTASRPRKRTTPFRSRTSRRRESPRHSPPCTSDTSRTTTKPSIAARCLEIRPLNTYQRSGPRLSTSRRRLLACDGAWRSRSRVSTAAGSGASSLICGEGRGLRRYWLSGIESYPIPAYKQRVEHREDVLKRGRAARLQRMARRAGRDEAE
mmetsp:Transcript_13713/g.44725  ORF Transcript_13713/g.44725 Transcript_13713/m.44725 type:complete len:222 (+) Transcript_13713:1085-1750(+)